MADAEVAVVGGGIVGVATAWTILERRPRRGVLVLEKEAELGRHQTGHNSGVLHSGIYYAPGSLRAATCREGKRLMEEFCAARGIPFERCGKVIVATQERERPALERIFERGRANGVRCERIDAARLREIEPYARGIGAIHVPEAGIVDFRAACLVMAADVAERGGRIVTGARVTRLERRADEVLLTTTQGRFTARRVVACAGLHADRVASLGGRRPTVRIVPFRGEFYVLRPGARRLVRGLIYPVPDPAFPFLGVHLTRTTDGQVHAGPNAVLAFAREGYRKIDFNPRDLAESLAYPGFLRLGLRTARIGAAELWRSLSKAAFARALQRLVPELRADDLEPAPAGVRAQAVGPDGRLVDDFLIQEDGPVVNVLNAPSPAATASLAIARRIAEVLG
jgi:L-2-hydroxyglutarate oxidase